MGSPKILPIPGVVGSLINSFLILICDPTSCSISPTMQSKNRIVAIFLFAVNTRWRSENNLSWGFHQKMARAQRHYIPGHVRHTPDKQRRKRFNGVNNPPMPIRENQKKPGRIYVPWHQLRSAINRQKIYSIIVRWMLELFSDYRIRREWMRRKKDFKRKSTYIYIN